MTASSLADRAGTFTFAADGDDPMPVTRLGYGAMRVTGQGVWGPPTDRKAALAVLRRSVELGVDFIDTADSYGPFVSEDLIREALHPYDGVVVATKAGLLRTGPGAWHALGEPNYLRQCIEMSLRRLDLERIDLFQLHRVDSRYPLADQIGVLAEAQQAGKIRHIGLSEVDVDTLEQARSIANVVSVQNIYNVGQRTHEDVLRACEASGVGFIPWFPIAGGELVTSGGAVAELASSTGYTVAQLSIAWLLHRSTVMLPIPGTGQVSHLEQNVAAADVSLTDEQWAVLDGLA